MKKILIGLVTITVIVFGTVFVVLFTPWGNTQVSNFIEEKANENQDMKFSIDKFILTFNQVDIAVNIDENSYINIKGNFEPFQREVNIGYDIDVKELSKLNNLTGMDLQGSLNTNGTVKGDQQLLEVEGSSNIFSSETKYYTSLVDFELSDITFNIKKAKIQDMLYMVKEPIYTTGYINIDGKIKNLEGDIVTSITNGKLNNTIVNSAFNQKFVSPFAYNGKVVTNLTKQSATSKVDFYTTMANIFVKKAVFNLDDSSLSSDYTINIDKLSKLYDVAQMKLRGKIALNGNIKKDENLLIDGKSALFGGALNFKLLNDDFTSTIKDVELLQILHMMYYPTIFSSKTDLSVAYNLASQKGLINGSLLNGQLKNNSYSTTIKTFTGFDLAQEVYDNVKVESVIDKNIIKTTLDAQSKSSKIVVPNSTLDTTTRKIDALVQTTIKEITFDTNISGTLYDTKVSVDTKQLLMNDKVKEEIDKAKEKVNEKVEEKAKSLLKSLF